MIEILIDGGGLVTINPEHIVYIKNDSGQALIQVTNGNMFLPTMSYDDLLDYLQVSGVIVHLDKETRSELDEDSVEAEEE